MLTHVSLHSCRPTEQHSQSFTSHRSTPLLITSRLDDSLLAYQGAANSPDMLLNRQSIRIRRCSGILCAAYKEMRESRAFRDSWQHCSTLTRIAWPCKRPPVNAYQSWMTSKMLCRAPSVR